MAQKLLLATCVWGSYSKFFTKYTLQSLISKGNILEKYKNIDIELLILSSKENIASFKNNKILKKIKSVNFLSIDKFLNSKKNKYETLSLSQKIIFNIVHEKNLDYLMLFYPDSIFSVNYIQNCLNLIKNGDVVLSPGPLVNMENLQNYLSTNKNPYQLSKLVQFTKENLHPYYESLINQEKQNFVNIFNINGFLIFNCFDLHISIMRKNLCNPNIDFDSVDSNYLSKIDIDFSKVIYANTSNTLFVISFESIFSSRPSFHYDKIDYNRLNLYKIFGETLSVKKNLKIHNFLNGYFILDINLTSENKILVNKHLNKLNEINQYKKYAFYKQMTLEENLHFFLKKIIRKILNLYFKTPANYRASINNTTRKSILFTKLKIRILYYVYS